MGDVILVTGASGMIGSRLVSALRARGDRVITHSRADGDLSEAIPAAEGVRHVFHLAGKSYVPDSWAHPAEFYLVNVQGTVNVLEFCRREKASLTFVSSYVYENPPTIPVSEDHPVKAFNPYSHSKILAEQVTSYYSASFGVPVTIVRPFNIYGPGQAAHFLIPTLLEQAISDAPALIVEDARPKRDYLFVDDLCVLLLRLMDARKCGTYNAGSGYSISVADLAALVDEAAGVSKPLISRENYRTGEVMDVVADISKARNDVGWEPGVSLKDGLRQTLLFLPRHEIAHGQKQ